MPKSKSHVPMRMCVICRGRFAKESMDRHVITSAGIVEADERRILPGRGFYCCADAKCQAKFANYIPRKKKGGRRRQGEI